MWPHAMSVAWAETVEGLESAGASAAGLHLWSCACAAAAAVVVAFWCLVPVCALHSSGGRMHPDGLAGSCVDGAGMHRLVQLFHRS